MSVYFRRYDHGKFISKRILNKEMHYKLLGTPRHLEDVRLVREAASEEERRKFKDPMKHQYLLDFNTLPNEDGTAAGTTRVANTVFIDYDTAELTAAKLTARQLIDRIVELREKLRLVMANFSLSSKGVHAVILRDPELTHRENIELFNAALGIPGLEPDPTCISNPKEGAFATTIKDIVFLDDRIYEEEEMPNLEARANKTFEPESIEAQTDNTKEEEEEEEEEPTAESQQAWMECEKRAGLTHGQVDVPHRRYANLKAILSKDFPVFVTSESQAIACIRHFMPVYWQTEEKKCRSFVKTAYHTWNNDFKMSAEAIKANAKLNAEAKTIPEENVAIGGQSVRINKKKRNWVAPPLPEKLPRPMELFLKPYPKQYHEALAISATVLWGVHASHFRTLYVNNISIAPNDYAIITSLSQEGKGWVDHQQETMLAKTLAADDEAAWPIWKKYKEDCKRLKKDNLPPAPKVKFHLNQTCSQTSILQLMEMQGDNGCLFNWFVEAGELAAQSGYKDTTNIFLEGWEGSMHRQFYTSKESFSTNVRVRLSVLATGTPIEVIGRYFANKNNGRNGTRNRFMTIPLPEEKELNFLPPTLTPLTSEEEAERDGYLLALWNKNKALGEGIQMLDMPKAREAVNNFLKKWEDLYKHAGFISKDEGMLVRRVAQHMMRAAIPYMALYGEETPESIDLINWLGEYVYYFQVLLFGEDAERQNEQDRLLLKRKNDARTSDTNDIFFSMPTEFTRQLWIQACSAAGINENQATTALSRLCNPSSGKQPMALKLGKGQYRRLM